MAIDRRAFLKLGLASSGLAYSNFGFGLSPAPILNNASIKPRSPNQWLLSACDDQAGQHFLYTQNQQTQQSKTYPVTQRFHAACSNKHLAIFIARRPGTEIKIIDLAREKIIRTITAEKQRHFFGHAVLSPDGHYLYAAENHFSESGSNLPNQSSSSIGLISVYSMQAPFNKVAEFPIGGIGPHELALMPDKQTLVVAVGGILTHPASGREKLNLNNLKSKLVYMNCHNGEILSSVDCPAPSLSLRHLTVMPSGSVIVGGQRQNEENNENTESPLLFLHHGLHHHKNEKTLIPLQAEEHIWQAHDSYIASVAISADGKTCVSSSPNGGIISVWDTDKKSCKKIHRIPDVAGLIFSPHHNGFIASNGLGNLFTLENNGETIGPLIDNSFMRWDNHLAMTKI